MGDHMPEERVYAGVNGGKWRGPVTLSPGHVCTFRPKQADRDDGAPDRTLRGIVFTSKATVAEMHCTFATSN